MIPTLVSRRTVAMIVAITTLATACGGGPPAAGSAPQVGSSAADSATPKTVRPTEPSPAPASAPPSAVNSWTRLDDHVALTDPAGALEMRSVIATADGLVAVGAGPGGAAVWTSTDGRRWHRVDDASLRSPGLVTMDQVIATQDGLLAVGHAASARLPGPSSVVWASRDGRSWTRRSEFPDAAAAGGFLSSIAVGKGAPVAVGIGFGTGDATIPAAWTADAAWAWHRAPDQPVLAASPDGSNGGWYDVVATADGVIAVGGETAPDAATSPDGQAWTPRMTEGTGALRSIAADPASGTAVAIGFGDAVVLRSGDDGRSWAREGCDAVFNDAALVRVRRLGSAWVAVGTQGPQDAGLPTVWWSSDGIAWARDATLDPAPGAAPTDVAVTPDDALVVVGHDLSGAATVWIGPPPSGAVSGAASGDCRPGPIHPPASNPAPAGPPTAEPTPG